MQVSVFDTYVTKKDGSQMHFDIIVPKGTNESEVYRFGRMYLEKKQQATLDISSKECRFCHVEHLQSFMEKDIQESGFCILEMQGC